MFQRRIKEKRVNLNIMAEVVTLIHSPTSSTNENSNFLEIIPEDENEEEGTEESGSAGDLSSGGGLY